MKAKMIVLITKYLRDEEKLVPWILPGFILAMVISNQVWGGGHLLSLGQWIGWLVNLVGILFIFSVIGTQLWFIVILMGAIAAKIMMQFYPTDTAVTAIFYSLSSIIFSFMGALVCVRHSKIMYKQVAIVCLINTFFMLLQLIGICSWTQFLTTHGTFGPEGPIFTPFYDQSGFMVSVIQRRPAGILYSNLFLSFIVMLGLVFNFTNKEDRFKWSTFVICLTMVLAMAKVIFFSFIVIVILIAIFGERWQKLEIFKASIYVPCFLAAYFVFFRSIFIYNLGLDAIKFSFFMRFNNIVANVPQENIAKPAIESVLINTVQPDPLLVKSHFSGYTEIMPIMPYLIIVLFMLLPLYSKGLRKMQPGFQKFVTISLLMMVITFVFPYGAPYWRAQIYWFATGIALLPIYYFISPQYFQLQDEAMA